MLDRTESPGVMDSELGREDHRFWPTSRNSSGLERNVKDQKGEADLPEANGAGQARDEPVDTIVPIETHCDGCEHLSDPPDFGCQHHDGRIVEVVDRSRVRVRGCPVVENGRQSE